MRLIDADAMRQDWLENGQNEYIYDTNAVLDSIDAQPTIEAEPVRWVETTEGWFMCSVCGDEWNSNIVPVTDFHGCPNCRAKMDGDSHDTQG